MHSLGVFDALIDIDSNFFINIIRLKESTVPEFQEAYKKLNEYFNGIATLLAAADEPTKRDKMYRAARARISFHEVNGINLGFSKSGHGSGWGKGLSDIFLADAYQIVKKGSMQPELFHLASLFEEGIGPDLLSDMIASIIKPQIKQYTLRIMNELDITKDKCAWLTFQTSGLVRNPKKKVGILLLPTEILHKLPIAKDWSEIDRVIAENDFIRREINAEIGEQWAKWASGAKKNYLKTHIFMNPDACSRVIDGYRKTKLEKYNPKEDIEYLVQCLLRNIKQADLFACKQPHPSSFDATCAIINIFKDWVENNRGWAEIHNAPTAKREKVVQRLMHLGAKFYVEDNNLDLSFEPDEGRGPVDIKLSRGTDKTIAEIKLSANPQYLHGFDTQISEYGKAERTKNMIFVFVDIGHPRRKSALLKRQHEVIQSGKDCPKLIIIDARPKKSASKYDSDPLDASIDSTLECDWDDMPDVNLDDTLFTDLENLLNDDSIDPSSTE